MSGREGAGIWEREWHFFLRSVLLEGSSLPFAPVENVYGASLKAHWTTERERFLLGSCVRGWPFLAGVCCYLCCVGVS